MKPNGSPTATDILRREHEAILGVLEAAEGAATVLERGERVPPETLEDLHLFFRLFAEHCHEAKEENVFFPLLLMKSVPRAGGPIGRILAEHEVAHAYLERLEEATSAYREGDPDAGRRWARSLRDYAALLRPHCRTEEEVLFLVADTCLLEVEQKALVQGFELLELTKLGGGARQRLETLREKLTAEIPAL